MPAPPLPEELDYGAAREKIGEAWRAQPEAVQRQAGFIIDRFRRADSHRQTSKADAVMEQAYKDYRSYRDYIAKEDHQAKSFVPLTMMHVETMFSRIMNGMFSPGGIVKLDPVDRTTDPIVARAVEHYQHWKLAYKTDFMIEYALALKTMLICAPGIMGVGLADDPEYPGELGTAFNVSPKDFWIEPGALSCRTASECFYYERLTAEELESRITAQKGAFHPGVNEQTWNAVKRFRPDTLALGSSQLEGLGVDPHTPNAFQEAIGRGGSADPHSGDPRYRVLWHHRADGSFRLLVEGVWLLWEHESLWGLKELPFTDLSITVDPWTFYPAGVPESIGSAQNEANHIRNARLDMANLVLQGAFISDETFPLDNVRLEPGHVLRVPGYSEARGNFTPLPFDARALQLGVQEEAILRRDADESLGLYGAQRGDPSELSPRSAATSNLAVFDQSDGRLAAQLLPLRKATQRILRQILAIDQKFGRPETVLEVLGTFDEAWLEDNAELVAPLAAWITDESQNRNRSIFDACRDIMPRLAPSNGSRAVRAQQMIQFGDLAARVAQQAPALDAIGIDARALVREIATEGFEFGTSGGVMLSKQQMAQNEQQRALEAAVQYAEWEIMNFLGTGRFKPPEAGQPHEIILAKYQELLESGILTDEQVGLVADQAFARKQMLDRQQQQAQAAQQQTPEQAAR